ncbi:hypothetical protein D5R40_15500 [Okeania hirsuta]|uniref:Uncharacterized protein n=1 Tax=Okeania hirsuta TaxID=1458930 RepID=A0A3N6PK05_9CYAN|nr:hypothetical protein D4Z78_30610 [Okeania hirsuta]RQH40919.1 hypothetical protein D5R40_15500 [Okeania hirsuta]
MGILTPSNFPPVSCLLSPVSCLLLQSSIQTTVDAFKETQFQIVNIAKIPKNQQYIEIIKINFILLI